VPDVTIAVATFRRPKGLERLLTALAKLETGASLRIVVADNDAVRREGAALAARVGADGYRWPIDAFVAEERGIAQARNALVDRALASGFDYIAMLDDDEWPEPMWLTAFLQAADETGADALHGAVVPEFQIPPGRWAKRCYGFIPLRGPTGAIAMIHGTANVLLRHSAFARLFMRLKMAGARFAWADEAKVHAEMPASRTSPRWAVQRAFRVGNSDMRVFLKHTRAVRVKLIESAKIAGALVLSPPLALLAAPLAGWRMLPVCKFARAVGKLSAALGMRYDEYAVTHGR